MCDFEDPGQCGWKVQSVDTYTWERRQRGASLPDSGPSSDFTTGTAAGVVKYYESNSKIRPKLLVALLTVHYY